MSEGQSNGGNTDIGFDPYPEISSRRRRGVRVMSAAAVALGLVVAGGSVAGASTSSSNSTAPSGTCAPPSSGSSSGRPPFGGAKPAAVGTVTAKGDGSFTLDSTGGTTVTVEVSDSTSYFDPGVTSPSIADVTVGEHVAVFGTESSGSVAATGVAIGLPPSGGKGGLGAPPKGSPSRSSGTSAPPSGPPPTTSSGS